MKKLFMEDNLYNRPDICEKCFGEDMEDIGVGRYKCTKCGHVMMDDYGKARSYIEKNIGASVFNVSEATGVSNANIRHMISEGKLMTISSDSRDKDIRCKGCGRVIFDGILCKECKQKQLGLKKRNLEKESN